MYRALLGGGLVAAILRRLAEGVLTQMGGAGGCTQRSIAAQYTIKSESWSSPVQRLVQGMLAQWAAGVSRR